MSQMQNHIYALNEARYRVERWTSHALRLGVWISASLLILGLLIAAFFPTTAIVLTSNPSFEELAVKIYSFSFDPVTLMYFGLVLLMLTPILRVTIAVFGFAVEHDRRFVFVSSIVLLMLMGEIVYSIFIKGY
jgi:uncharacterized membrane protein